MDPSEFESIVKALVEEQLGQADLEIRHRAKVPGKRSGYQHEVDLSFEVDLLGTRVLVILECKAYGRPVSVDDVLEFCTRVDDIGAHKGILVSTSGFTDGAKRLADSHRVALVQAQLGQWHIIGRFTGPPPPRWSTTLFYFAKAAAIADNSAVALKLSPINEVDLAAVYAFDTAAAEALQEERAQKRGRSLSVVFEILSPGGTVPAVGLLNLMTSTSVGGAQ